MSKYSGFKEVELRKPERSTFDLSHESRVSTQIGKLTPIFISETLPNDTFFGSSEVLIKLAPMLAPILHRLNLYVHFFFVPARQLWEDWEPFITGGRLGVEITSPPIPPYFDMQAALLAGGDFFALGSLADYLGVPKIADADTALWINRRIAAMPFAAYNKIWYDYYRDRNYHQDETWSPLVSGLNGGPIYSELLQMHQRCWEADYFTTSLPWTQRGAEVLTPLAGTGHVVQQIGGGTLVSGPLNVANPAGESVLEDNFGTLAEFVLDSSDVSINDFRRAIALQQWMERNALAGSRYKESIMAHFARKTSDGRLQRAEYLGGGKAVIQISEVMTTAYSEDATAEVVPPGTMAGRGSTYSTTNKFSYNCEEHGFVLGILSVLPTSGYMQGWPRMFFARNTFLDYPWPSFAHLGEQPVYSAEVWADPSTLPVTNLIDEAPVFGYQSRYADWKFMHNTAHGDFRESLDYWHLVRKFSAEPNLNEDFVTTMFLENDRIFNVTGVDTLWMYIYNNVKVKRSLPYFGTPKLM